MKENIKKFFKQLFTSKRFLSLLWRAGAMVLAFVVEYTLQNLGIFNLSPQLTVLLGLVLGEISKALNNAAKGVPTT